MKFASTRMITKDIAPIVQFYEKVTGAKLTIYTPDFAELRTESATLAIGSVNTLALFGNSNFAQPASNNSVILEFLVDDVDQRYEEISELIKDTLIQAPTTMPWGNRSLLFKDPDGNIVNFFTPVSEDARQRAGK